MKQQVKPSLLVYIVDDDARLREMLHLLLGDAGYECECFPDGGSFLPALRRKSPDLVLLDLVLPDADGVDLLRKALELQPELPVVMMSGQGTIKAAVETVQLGAFDFLEKPLDAGRVKLSVRNALASGQLQKQVGRLKDELAEQFRMIGDSPALTKVRDLVDRVAPTSASVLIMGESGVGKELVARAIHLGSPRAFEAFVALNCAAVPRELIESELFGYEKGAFTGATGARKGKLQEADCGTLFLDEVADMSLETQARLLRFLENTEIQKLGGTGTIKLDVRVIAATNKDLPACVKQGVFREDLFHRLNVVNIRVPPLHERREDIEALAAHFLDHYCRSHNRPLQFGPDCWPVLKAYRWPGNVRELRNVIERVVVLSLTNPIEGDELRTFLDQPARPDADGTLEEAAARGEREAVERALEQASGNMTEAARILGIERQSIYRVIRRYNITRPVRS